MTTTTEKIHEDLSKAFSDKVIGKLPKGGKTFDFVPIAEVIARMNSVLGTENWGEQDVVVERDKNNPEWVVARTTVWAVIDSKRTEKVGFGSQKITMRDKQPMDLGNEFKGAHSDAFKKACTKFGVALHLARDESAIMQEIHDRAVRERAEAPEASQEAKDALVKAIGELEEEQIDTIKGNFRKAGVPSLKSDDFTEAHLSLVQSWING